MHKASKFINRPLGVNDGTLLTCSYRTKNCSVVIQVRINKGRPEVIHVKGKCNEKYKLD